MPAKYLLPCACGRQVIVEPSQAGGRVRCECGQELQVPTFRDVLLLPKVKDSDGGDSESTWGLRQAVTTAMLILAAMLVAGAGYCWFARQDLVDFESAERNAWAAESIEELSPLQAWQLWIDIYKPLPEQGVGDLRPTENRFIAAQNAKFTLFAWSLLAGAGVCAAAAGLAYLLIGDSRRRAGE